MTVLPTTQRWTVVLAALAMLAAACAPGAEVTTTTAPPDDDGTTAPTPAPTGQTGFTYEVGIFEDMTTDNIWSSLDADATVWNSYVLGPTQTALFGIQPPEYLLVPSLAAGEPVQPEQEGDLWVVEQPLRQGVLWSDGTEITAGDVAFTFRVVRDFELSGNWAGAVALADPENPDQPGIVDVEAPDLHTLRITFNQRPGLAIWPHGIGVLMSIMPEHFWADVVEGARTSQDPKATLYAASGAGAPSAGPVVYDGREPGAFARTVANDGYYFAGTTYGFYEDGSYRQTNPERGFDEVLYGPGEGDPVMTFTDGPFLGEAVYSVYTSQDAAVLALRQGEIQFMLNSLGLQRGLRDQLAGEGGVELIANPSNAFRYLAFNMRKFPGNDLAFRKAVEIMIDKEFMAQSVLQGAAIPVYSMVPEGNTFWYNPDVPRAGEGLSEQERLEEAVRILEAGGWTWEQAPHWDEDLGDAVAGVGLRGPDGQVVEELELLAPGPSYDPLRATYAVWVEAWAARLGIPMRANPTSFNVLVDKVFTPGEASLEWDMYILGWTLGNPALPSFHRGFFHSSQDTMTAGGFNTPGYDDPEFDALADQFQAALTLEEARDLVHAMDRKLLGDAPYVVLFTTPILEAYQDQLVFPFTDLLDGIQAVNGVPGLVQTQ